MSSCCTYQTLKRPTQLPAQPPNRQVHQVHLSRDLRYLVAVTAAVAAAAAATPASCSSNAQDGKPGNGALPTSSPSAPAVSSPAKQQPPPPQQQQQQQLWATIYSTGPLHRHRQQLQQLAVLSSQITAMLGGEPDSQQDFDLVENDLLHVGNDLQERGFRKLSRISCVPPQHTTTTADMLPKP